MITSSIRLWPLAGLLGLALSSCGSTAPAPTPSPLESAILQGAPIELLRSPEFDRIAELEEQRATDGGRLMKLAESGSLVVRIRAATALGRMPFPEYGDDVTAALCRLLADPGVNRTAAHALGMRGDPSAIGVLGTYLNDADPLFRASVVAAASRFDDAHLHRSVMIALRDADLNVRIEAALGTALWNTSEPRAAEIDRALVDTLRPYRVVFGHTNRTAVEAELVWRTLYALGRRKSSLGTGPFLQYGDSEIPMERLFALRGLGSLPVNQAAIDVATRALLGDTKASDWRVAHAACASLSSFSDARCMQGLAAAAGHESFHVRAQAMAGLGQLNDKQSARRAISLIKQGLADVSSTVRAAALLASVNLVDEGSSLLLIERELENENFGIRLGALEALGQIESEERVKRLRQLADNPNRQLANRAVELLGGLNLAEQRPFLHKRLSHADTGMRLAALEALAAHPDPSDVPFLIAAFESTADDISGEFDYRVLECLGNLHATDGARECVQGALVNARPFLRLTAKRVLTAAFDMELSATHTPPRPEPGPLPLAGVDYPRWSHNPLVEVNTSKGSMIFQLFPEEAPLHVFSFLELAQAGTYEGLNFHRVVSNFVAQGGDYRGDGNGGKDWRGGSLRHEISPRKYTTGSLGMPRNLNLESGGGQLFITHLPTPHLDGRYTIFGELIRGGDVLDALELGDRILSVELIPEPTTDS